jgi:hypothetical protein
MPNKTESAADVEQWFRNQAADLWPAALGSLCLRRSPCVRDRCQALYCRIKGRRYTVYIPDELVPDMQRSLDNGRKLQELLHQAAMRYAKALKHDRTAKTQKVKK